MGSVDIAADSLQSLENELRPDLLEVYAHVGAEALGRAQGTGRPPGAESLHEDLDFIVAELRAIRVNHENVALAGGHDRAAPDRGALPSAVVEIDIDPAELESARRRAAGLGLSGDTPAEWTLDQERRGTVAVTQRLAGCGVRPEIVEAFRAGADFLDAAASVGEGTAPKEPHFRLSYGGPATVRELRFVGSELEAIAAQQIDSIKKTTPAHDVQYVVITGKLSDSDVRRLGAELQDIVRAIKAQPGQAHSKAVKTVVAMPSTLEGRDAQRVADRMCARLGLQPEFGNLMVGTYAAELARREAEFITRERVKARQKGVSIGPQIGLGLGLKQ